MFVERAGCTYFELASVPPSLLERVPQSWRDKREERDGHLFHVTVRLPGEAGVDLDTATHQGHRDQWCRDKDGGDQGDMDADTPTQKAETDIFLLGTVVEHGVAFAPVVFPAAEVWRAQRGLPSLDLHVTLGFQSKDVHDISKGAIRLQAESSVCWPEVRRMLASEVALKSMAGRAAVNHLHTRIAPLDLELHKASVRLLPRRERATSLITMFRNGHAVPALRALCKVGHDPAAIAELAAESSALQHDRDAAMCVADYLHANLGLWYGCTEAGFSQLVAPRNFSRIEPGLYASALINSKHLPLLKWLGVTRIVNLMEEVHTSLVDERGLEYVHIPIEDRCGADKATLGRIVDALSSPGCTVVHCLGGKGRTAMAFTAYLIRERGRTASDVHAQFVHERETILTPPQHEALAAFALCPFADRSEAVRISTERRPRIIVMCGLPGSGKSTFTKHLARFCDGKIVRASQDEMGRKGCERAVRDAPSDITVIVDRCNPTMADRAEWLGYLRGNERAWCIFVDTLPEECAYRAEKRKDHETLRGTGARKVVMMVAKQLEPPTAGEAGFSQVISLSNQHAVNQLLERWRMEPIDIPVQLHKFPRTRHLVNLGSASRDDLLLTTAESTRLLGDGAVFIEEKIDGANLGLSMDTTAHKIVAQNRGHYVTPSYHAQFAKLGTWIDTHAAALWPILEDGNHVLFGEWCAMEHSIAYTRLPGLFVAFDLMDKRTGTFASRQVLQEALQGSGIPLVPLICHRNIKSLEEAAELVQTPSQFYDGPVEGIYVRKCWEDLTIDRAKVVRSDFICGSVHWTKQKYKWNTVVE